MRVCAANLLRWIGIASLLFYSSCRENVPGESVPPAEAHAVICSSDALLFGSTVTNVPVDTTMTITNDGTGAILAFTDISMTAPFAFKDGVFPGTGGTCTSQLAVNSSCTVVLTFTPTEVTDYSQSVTVGYTSFAGSSSVSCTFSGSGLRQHGSLDTSFHTDGLFTTTLLAAGNGVYGVLVQTDGKTIVIGSATSGGGSDHVALIRLDTDGSLDTTFHTDGKVTTSDGLGISAIQQTNGAFVVASHSWTSDLQILRYTSNGQLDSSFNTTGRQLTSFDAGEELAKGIFLQTDGRIVVGGSASVAAQYVITFARFHSNGTLDTTFSDDGRTTKALGVDAEMMGFAKQSDGRIVGLASTTDISSNTTFALIRLTSNGSLDTSFSADGVATASYFNFDLPAGLAIQTDGALVVGGTYADDDSLYHYSVTRFTTNGSLDTQFNTTGKLGIALTTEAAVTAHDLTLQTDGQIVMGAQFPVSPLFRFAVIRWQTDGTLDTAFGSGGVSHASIGAGDNINGAVAVSGEKIIRVGRHVAGSDSVFGIARFWQ